jgi:peptidyl-prolyl cis-trans isomerase C
VKFYVAILAFTPISALFAQAPATPGEPAPPAAAAPADPNRIVLVIGDQKMTAAQYDQLVAALPAQYQTAARGAGKRGFGERIVELKILAEEAEKRKLDQQPQVHEQLTFQRENLLAQAMFENLQSSVKVDQAAVEKYYNEHKGEFEVIKARHILIRVKGAPMAALPGKPELSDEEALAKALAILKRVQAGEDFATLARTESDDSSASQGGDLGEFRKGMMVPPFEQAAFAAKVGTVTEPVKTPFGYHLIKVEVHSTKPLPEVRADIEKKLRPELASQEVTALRKSTTVTMDESFFGPAAPAVPGLPGAVRPPAASPTPSPSPAAPNPASPK